MLSKNEIYSLLNYGEAVTGSDEERKLAARIKSIMEETTDEVRTEEIRVMSWKVEESEVSIDGITIEPSAFTVLPYSPSSHEEGNIKSDFMISYLNTFAELPFVYEECINRDSCKGLFVSLDDRLRKFVIKTPPFLQRKPGSPPPKPVFYVERKELNKLKQCSRVSIDVKSTFSPYATGQIVEGIINGRDDNNIVYVTAHHDHWFTGFRDNMSSIIALFGIKRGVHERRIVSFTAEESGSPYFSSWSWSYGSTFFTTKRREMENTVLNVNLDNIHVDSLEFIYTPGLSNLVKDFNAVKGFDPYNDGYSFVRRGIPSIMIESRNNPFYHSEEDIPDEATLSYVTTTLPAQINKILDVADNDYKLDRKEITDFVKDSYQYISTEIKSYLMNLSIGINENLTSLFKNVLMLTGAVISPVDKVAEVKLFPALYGVSRANRSYVDVEDLGRIEKIKDNGYGLGREYLMYLDSLREKFSDMYLNEIYNSLKEFF